MGQHHEQENGGEEVAYEEALEKAGTGKFQYFLIITGGLIIFSSYVSVGAVSYILPAAQCDLHMDSQAKGTLLSSGFVGLIISCHLWGFLSDTLGRRYILIRCLFVDGLLYFVTSITPYYSLILVLRFINGFASSGGVACVYVYVGEFITNKYRTKYLMTAAMIASFSYFITPTYAWLIIRSKLAIPLYPGLVFKSWRLFYAVNGIPSLICVILLYFLPESPKFLLVKEKTEQSIQVFKTIHKVNGKKDDFLVKSIKMNENEKVATLENNKNKIIAFLRLIWKQTAPLFKQPHRMNFALICLTLYLTYFSNGGMYLWLPETMNRLATFQEQNDNENANFCNVVQYSRNRNLINMTKTSIMTNYDVGQTTTVTTPLTEPVCNEEVNVIIYFYLGLLGVTQTINLGFIATISKIWSKKYILVVLTFLALLSSIAIQYIKVTDIIKYDTSLLIIFTGAMVPITNSMVVEFFPANLRGMAGCLTLMCCRLGTVTANIIAGTLIDHSCPAFIWCFIVAMSLCLITVLFMPKKSQELEEKNSTHV